MDDLAKTKTKKRSQQRPDTPDTPDTPNWPIICAKRASPKNQYCRPIGPVPVSISAKAVTHIPDHANPFPTRSCRSDARQRKGMGNALHHNTSTSTCYEVCMYCTSWASGNHFGHVHAEILCRAASSKYLKLATYIQYGIRTRHI